MAQHLPGRLVVQLSGHHRPRISVGSFRYLCDIDIRSDRVHKSHALSFGRQYSEGARNGKCVDIETHIYTSLLLSMASNCVNCAAQITDTIGFISQLSTLVNYGDNCLTHLDEHVVTDGHVINAQIKLGPGYIFYCLCLFGAFMRALMHWLTPLPDRGSGCSFEVPQYLLERLDLDGDGQISWKELRVGYRTYIQGDNLRSSQIEQKYGIKALPESQFAADALDDDDNNDL